MKIILRSAACMLLSSVVTAAFDEIGVTTYHNDNGRTGENTQETILTPRNVKPAPSSVTLDSWAPAQPLYVPNLTIGGTAHNTVYVATLNNSIYAFDADNGAELWTKNYGPATSFVPLCHDSSFQSSPSLGAGIVGTPVIDSAAGVMYFVAKTGNGTVSSPYMPWFCMLWITRAEVT